MATGEKKSKRYDIGKVLFVIPANKNAIVPVMIVEEVVRKTLKGEEVNYRVQTSADTDKIIMLSDLQGEIFETMRELKKELEVRTQKSIIALIARAKERAVEWFKFNEKQEAKKEANRSGFEDDEDNAPYNHLKVLGHEKLKPFIPSAPKNSEEGPLIENSEGEIYTVIDLGDGQKAKLRQ